MRKTRAAAVLSMSLLFGASSVFAEPELTAKYSDSELIQIVKDEGYSAVKKIKEGAIRIKVEGRTYVLFNKDDGDLQAYYALAGAKISYEDINEWNRTKRLSRAYLDSDEDPVLEADLLANGGLTIKHVTEFFRIFKMSVRSYREFISEHNQD